jgi:hypothetical protein
VLPIVKVIPLLCPVVDASFIYKETSNINLIMKVYCNENNSVAFKLFVSAEYSKEELKYVQVSLEGKPSDTFTFALNVKNVMKSMFFILVW